MLDFKKNQKKNQKNINYRADALVQVPGGVRAATIALEAAHRPHHRPHRDLVDRADTGDSGDIVGTVLGRVDLGDLVDLGVRVGLADRRDRVDLVDRVDLRKVKTPIKRQHLRGLLSPIFAYGSYLESYSDGTSLKLFMIVEKT